MPSNTSSAGSSTITQPVGSQTAPTIVTKAANALRQIFFTASDLADPNKLYQVLQRFNASLTAALTVLGQNPLQNGNLILGVAIGNGAQAVIMHGLGRPYVGYLMVNDHGVSGGSIFNIGTLPPGVTTSQAIALVNESSASVFDFWVF